MLVFMNIYIYAQYALAVPPKIIPAKAPVFCRKSQSPFLLLPRVDAFLRTHMRSRIVMPMLLKPCPSRPWQLQD